MTTPIPIPDVPPAQASEFLCGPWASPADVPEKWRPRVSTNQWIVTLGLAAEILFQLSGHRWRGVGCADRMELRSYPDSIGMGTYPMGFRCGCWLPTGRPGSVADAWNSSAVWRGSHPSPTAVLIEDDATAVTEVKLGDGTVLAASAYRLLKNGYLERTDGKGWSLCGEEGPTLISYTKGVNPPAGGIAACVNLAIEFVRSWCGDQGCAIPANATQVTRQGISITMDPSVFLKEMRTGVPIVDTWLNAVNPPMRSGGRRSYQGSVWTPDIPTGTRIGPLP